MPKINNEVKLENNNNSELMILLFMLTEDQIDYSKPKFDIDWRSVWQFTNNVDDDNLGCKKSMTKLGCNGIIIYS